MAIYAVSGGTVFFFHTFGMGQLVNKWLYSYPNLTTQTFLFCCPSTKAPVPINIWEYASMPYITNARWVQLDHHSLFNE